MNQKERARKEFLLAGSIVILLCLSILNLFVLLNIKVNPVYSEPPLLEVNIVYEADNITEQIKILGYNINEETGLILAGTNDYVYVKFYNLSKTDNYSLDRAGFFDYRFTNTSEITFMMWVYEDNWCFLNIDQTGLIWVWIGTIGN